MAADELVASAIIRCPTLLFIYMSSPPTDSSTASSPASSPSSHPTISPIDSSSSSAFWYPLLLQQCLTILKSDSVQSELKKLFTPLSDLLRFHFYPYLYFAIALLFLLVLLMFANLFFLIYLFHLRRHP